MREEVAHRVHNANGCFTILDANVHVQTEDQIRASHQLQILNHAGVSRVGIDLLRAPVREGMRRSRNQHQPMLPRQQNHLAAQIEEIQPGLFHRVADVGAHLHHGLVHLSLDALLQSELAMGQHLGRDV